MHESSPLAATTKLMTVGGLAKVRGPQHRRRRRCNETAKAQAKVSGRILCYHTVCWRLDVGGRRRQRLQIAGPGVEVEQWEDVCEGLCFGWKTGGPVENKRERERPKYPQPRKQGLDLG
jgi:hypothetical protein